jgi:hypothetical protein
MKSADVASNDKQGLPPGAVKIGTVSVGEKPRTSSFLSYAAMAVGYVTSFFSSIVAEELVVDLAKEDVSAYDLKALKGKGFGAGFQNGLSRSVDLKLWKSNTARVVTLLGGIFLTNFAVKKIEQHTFKKRHGELNMDKVDKILQGNFDPAPDASQQEKSGNWQDKVKKTEVPQQGIGA